MLNLCGKGIGIRVNAKFVYALSFFILARILSLTEAFKKLVTEWMILWFYTQF